MDSNYCQLQAIQTRFRSEYEEKQHREQLNKFEINKVTLENRVFLCIIQIVGIHSIFKGGVMINDIKESIKELNILLKDDKIKQNVIELFRNNSSFSEFKILELDKELAELLNNVFKISSNNYSRLENQLNNLNNLIQEQKPFVERIFERQRKASNQTKVKANEFVWNLKNTLFEIENYISIDLNEKPTLERIAEELNKRSIKTPNNKDAWYPTTVRLAKLRIQEIQRNTMLNALE